MFFYNNKLARLTCYVDQSRHHRTMQRFFDLNIFIVYIKFSYWDLIFILWLQRKFLIFTCVYINDLLKYCCVVVDLD